MNAYPFDEPDMVVSVHSDQDREGVLTPALRENPHALANFVRHAPVALAMFDQQMRYVAVSQPWAVLFEVADMELVGKSHYDVFPQIPERFRKAHQEAQQGAHLGMAEAPWQRTDGTISWHRWELAPWHDEAGEIGGVVLFNENVSTPKAIDEALRLLSVEAAGMDFTTFARHATRRLSQILEMDMVQLSVPCADAPGWLETVAVFADGETAPNYRYPLAGTPCDVAMQRRICIYGEGVREKFPDDADLTACNIEAYGGSALSDSHGEMLGVLSMMSRKAFHNPEMVRAVINLAGIGIGGMLQIHRAKVAAEASERFSRVLLDTVNSHIVVLDGAGQIIFANEAWHAYARDNHADPQVTGVGANYLAVCEAAVFASPEAAEATRLLREVMAGQRLEGVCEYPCPTPAGMTWYRCTFKRFTDLEQAMVLVAHENVSDIKQATRRSQQIENKFRQMFDSAPDAALIVDEKGVIQMANRQAELLYQFSPGMLAGQPVETLIRKDSQVEKAAVMEDYVARLSHSTEGTVWGLTYGIRHDGTDFPAEISLSRFVEDDKTLYIVAVRDVSLRVAAEADRLARQLAEQANQAKSVFLATMSHEIRTPLNAVLGFSEVLSLSELNNDQASLLQHMRGSAQHLLGLIDNVLDLSKIEAGEMALEAEAFDLHTLIVDNARALSGYASQRNVRISLFIDPAVPGRITSDPSRLRQVVYNLLGNAIKFSGGRKGLGQVYLRAEMVGEAASTLRLTVRDNGIGMNDAVRRRVFQPFVQGESTITRRFGGTGLGLAITKRIIDRLRGKITVKSAPDIGSTFTVTLPVEAMAPQTPSAPQRLKGIHCLLAESAAYLAEDLARYLHHEGAQVTRLKPEDGISAVQAAAAGTTVLISGSDFPSDCGLDADLPRVLLCDRAADAAASGSDSSADIPPPDVACLRTELLTCDALVMAVQRVCDDAKPDAARTPSAPQSVKASDTTTPRFDARNYDPILVVEDDPMNQKVILRQLSLLGLQPDLAENGAMALEMWQQKPYGLILADLHMPVMDGYAMTAAIRAQQAKAGPGNTRAVSIVALTANVLRDEIGRTQNAGFDGFLTKPMTLAQLADTLKGLLTPVGGRH